MEEERNKARSDQARPLELRGRSNKALESDRRVRRTSCRTHGRTWKQRGTKDLESDRKVCRITAGTH